MVGAPLVPARRTVDVLGLTSNAVLRGGKVGPGVHRRDPVAVGPGPAVAVAGGLHGRGEGAGGHARGVGPAARKVSGCL